MNLSRSTIRQLVANAVINGIIEQVPESYKLAGETMPASQAVTSAMAIAAAMKDEAPDRDRRMDWNSLENHLTELYQYYDPDMDDTDAMQQGVRDCEALMEITA